jgi:ABC-type phosphate transport system substrate-binding protein
MINRLSQGLFVAMVLGVAAPVAGQGYVVVVNAANPVASLTKDDASKLFLGKTVNWESGGRVVAVDQDKSSPVREAFSAAVHGKSAGAVESYWLQQVFAGKGEAPAKLANDAAVLAFVSANRGAVGYVAASAAVSGGVKKITVN